jgi:large repetitive protein
MSLVGDYNPHTSTRYIDKTGVNSVVCDSSGIWSFTSPLYMKKRMPLVPNSIDPNYPYDAYISIVDPLDPGITSTAPFVSFGINSVTNIDIDPLLISSSHYPTFVGTCSLPGAALEFAVTIPPSTTAQEIVTTQTCPAFGTWSFTPTISIPNGPYKLVAKSFNPAGYPFDAQDISPGVIDANFVTINIPSPVVTPTYPNTYPYLTNDNTPYINGACEPGAIMDFIIISPPSVTNPTGSSQVIPTINCPTSGPLYGKYNFSPTIPILDLFPNSKNSFLILRYELLSKIPRILGFKVS